MTGKNGRNNGVSYILKVRNHGLVPQVWGFLDWHEHFPLGLSLGEDRGCRLVNLILLAWKLRKLAGWRSDVPFLFVFWETQKNHRNHQTGAKKNVKNIKKMNHHRVDSYAQLMHFMFPKFCPGHLYSRWSPATSWGQLGIGGGWELLWPEQVAILSCQFHGTNLLRSSKSME